MDIALIKKQIRDFLGDPQTLDKDVFMYEKVLEFKDSPYTMDIIEVIANQPFVSKPIWEEIAEACFIAISNKINGEREREIAVRILEKYRNFLKEQRVDLTTNDIPDDILNFETKGRKYTRVSKLRYPLEGIDLKVLDIFDVDSLNEMEEDVTLLLAMLRKRREQLTKPKEECRFSHKIYKDRSSKKQMIKLHVGKYHPVHDNKGNFLYTHEETLYEIRLPFKKSDAAGIDAVNQKIKEINEKYKLKVSLF